MFHSVRSFSIHKPRSALAALTATGAVLLLAGCQSASTHREEADRAAAEIIAEKQEEALGESEPFTIERPSQTFRQRLMLDQQLPSTGTHAYGVDWLEEPEHWPDVGAPLSRPEAVIPEPDNGGEVVEINLVEALQIGAANSRAYQSEKESLFRTALQLDLERFRFDTTFRGALEAMFTSDQGAGDNSARAGGELGIQRQLESGADLSGRLALDLVNLLRGEGTTTLNIVADGSISVPLLRGSGRHIVTEPLTQAERDVVYAILDFEDFKRDFAVGVASEYFTVLQGLDRIANAEANFRRILLLVEQNQALHDMGRITGIELDQALQDLLSARQGLINAREGHSRSLDRFKLTLGLPTDARIALDDEEFEYLRTDAEAMFGADIGDTEMDIDIETDGDSDPEGFDEYVEPDAEAGGRYEFSEERALELAFENRNDLRIAEGEIFDAQRGVVVAADALRPGLNLTGTATYPGTVTSSSARFTPSDGIYTAGMELDMPWSRRSERISFRQSLIQLDSAVRQYQQVEDQVKFDTREALRSLLEQREVYRIQTESLDVAERRVEQSQAFQEVGRANTRDVLESNDDLLQAQNALVDSLVSYRVAELELQRDLGLLQVDHEGIWNEYDPNGVRQTEEEETNE